MIPRRKEPSSLRIASGTLRGRKLLSPPGLTTRPITGLAKKSLFGMLQDRLAEATVVDLYCGTGTLGLEALSCGARRCWFAERWRIALDRLRRNIDACGLGEQAVVWAGNIESRLGWWLEQLDDKIDVAFVDPPYASARRWRLEQVTVKIFAPLARSLARDGVVILRLPDDVSARQQLEALTLQRLREYGDMKIAWYELAGGGTPPADR